MPARHRWIGIAIAVPGLMVCILALADFIRKMLTNGLPWSRDFSPREYYTVVGDAYSRGFGTGFFLCFFLVLATLAVSNGLTRRRRPKIVRDRLAAQVLPGSRR